MLLPGEKIEPLFINGLQIIQKDKGFRYGTDAVLLSHFTKIPECARVMDLGTGTGILPLLLSAEKAAHLTGLEYQREFAEMAQRSVLLNHLEDRIKIVCGDLREAVKLFGRATFDVVTANPPYKRAECGLKNNLDADTAARHEIHCTLEDVISAACHLLVPGGCFNMVNRSERLVDAMELLRKYRLEPKELQFVSPKQDKSPILFLIRAVKHGGKNLVILPQRFLDENPAGTLCNLNQEEPGCCI